MNLAEGVDETEQGKPGAGRQVDICFYVSGCLLHAGW